MVVKKLSFVAQCSSWSKVLLACFVTWQIGLLVWSVYSAQQSSVEDGAIILKQFLAYCIVLQFLSKVEWQVLEPLIELLGYTASMGSPSSSSKECLLGVANRDEQTKFFIRMIFGILPFVWLVLLSLFLLVCSRLQIRIFCAPGSSGTTSSRVQAGAVVWTNIFLADVVGTLCEALPCWDVSDKLQLLVWNASVNCASTNYVVGAAVFGSAVAGILSLFLTQSFCVLWANRNNLEVPEIKAAFGYLYVGYRQQSYFMEIVVILRKCLLQLVSVFAVAFPALRLTLVQLILIPALVIHLFVSPYKSTFLNNLETSALMISNLSLVLAIYVQTKPFEQSTTGVWTCAIIMIISNTIMVCIFCTLLFRVYGKKIIGVVGRCRVRKSAESVSLLDHTRSFAS